MNNAVPILVDENIKPNESVLRDILKRTYVIYEKLVTEISSDPFNLNVEWNYYKDGNSWLCKATNKKKTIFWLSAHNEHFNITFYFTEKFDVKIEQSEINDNNLKQYFENKPIGKLKPITIKVDSENNLTDVMKLIFIRK